VGTGDGGDYASIDPGALKGAADSLQKSVDGVNGNIPGLKGDFGYLGISTAHLDTLTKAASNLASLIPELRRRQSMAQQLVAENPAGGKVAYFQGDLLGQFRTVAAATAQAHIDAQNVKHAADHHERIPDSVYDDLRKYADDADFSAAFVNDLGTKYVGALLLDAEDTDNPGDKPDAGKMSAIGNLLATASHRVTFDRTYLDSLDKSLGDDWGLSTNARSAFDVFTPVLQYGVWDKQDLEDIADTALGYPKPDMNIWPADGTAMKWIFTGLANNPMASGDYFSKHRQDLYNYGQRSSYVADHGDAASAFARFINEATVGSRSYFGNWANNGGPKGNLAEDNAAWLIQHVANDKYDRWSHDLSLTYADMAQAYIDDIAWSIGSPTDAGSVDMPNRDGIEISQEDWKKFLRVPMRDDEGAARLSATFSAWLAQANDQSAADSSHNPDANFWDDYTMGRMRGLFLVDYQAVMDEKGRNAKEQEEAIDKVIEQGVDWVSDPEGVPKSILKLAASSLLSLVAKKIMEDPGKKLDLSDFSDNHAWESKALSYFHLQKVLPYNDGQFTWNGDPKFYEDLYHGNFTQYIDPTGLMDETKLRANPQALQAYNEWLKDPAVQAAIAEHYKSEDLGQDDAALPGG